MLEDNSIRRMNRMKQNANLQENIEIYKIYYEKKISNTSADENLN